MVWGKNIYLNIVFTKTLSIYLLNKLIIINHNFSSIFKIITRAYPGSTEKTGIMTNTVLYNLNIFENYDPTLNFYGKQLQRQFFQL
jgi:hypothetical protein